MIYKYERKEQCKKLKNVHEINHQAGNDEEQLTSRRILKNSNIIKNQEIQNKNKTKMSDKININDENKRNNGGAKKQEDI